MAHSTIIIIIIIIVIIIIIISLHNYYYLFIYLFWFFLLEHGFFFQLFICQKKIQSFSIMHKVKSDVKFTSNNDNNNNYMTIQEFILRFFHDEIINCALQQYME